MKNKKVEEEAEEMMIEIREKIINDLYWKNYPNCPIDGKPMEIVYSFSGKCYQPGMETCEYYEIKYRCLHCFHVEYERDST